MKILLKVYISGIFIPTWIMDDYVCNEIEKKLFDIKTCSILCIWQGQPDSFEASFWEPQCIKWKSNKHTPTFTFHA